MKTSACVKISALILPALTPGALAILLSVCIIAASTGQAVPYARTFPKSKEEVESTLKAMQAYAGQKLPVVDGFVALGDQPLNRYERAFYQLSIDVLADTPNTTIVRVAAKITAWYADRDPSKSEYQVLSSNGRLELDLLDRLSDKLGGKLISVPRSSVEAPRPKLEFSGGSVTSPTSSGKSATSPADVSGSSGDELAPLRMKREAEEKRAQQLTQELQSLQEIQHNQARPANLVVARKSGTPVLAKPAIGSRVLFTAAADDEFEFLDAEGEWIHVKISGASRGYIRRSSLDLPEAISARLKSPNESPYSGKDPTFRVVREETSTFPGDWEPLRGKTVRIYSVQPASAEVNETPAKSKLEFAASLFRKFPSASSSSPNSVQGIVVIFDSADGGLVASTVSNAQQFASGVLSLEAFWKSSYADLPQRVP
ncbi:MAG: hypothetical protein JWO71_1178 [Candidatus Acidoferrum typicum]|nr:hypothetical protein [Candidatus Acidoferrum typicum]